MSFPRMQREGRSEWGGRRGTPVQDFPQTGLALPSARSGQRSARERAHAEAHLQPKVTPRNVGRSNFERAASGAPMAFLGEVCAAAPAHASLYVSSVCIFDLSKIFRIQ